MILLGGLSAFVADILGYKIGKKRLSIWHIRPKYIARISVTLAGMLIPLLVVLTIYAASSEFRLWVNKGRAAIQEAKEKTVDLGKKTAELNEKSSLLAQTNKDLVTIKGQKDTLAKDLAQRKREAVAQQAKATVLSGTIARQQRQVGSLSRAVAQAAASIRSSRSENSANLKLLAKTKNLLGAEQVHLKSIQASLDQVSAQRNQAETAKYAAEAEFTKLSKLNREFEKTNSELSKTLLELQGRLPALTEEIARLKEEQTSGDKALRDLEEKIREATNIVMQVKKENDTYAAFSRTSTLSFLRNEELGRIIVPASLSESDARNLLSSLLRLARSRAIEKGAKPDLAYPFAQEVGILGYRPNRTEMTQMEVEQAWAEQIMRSSTTRILVARSATNRYSGEPVTLDLVFFPNPIVFREREVIAEGRVDGREPDQVIFSQIREFVRTYVNAKAKRVKMVPVITRDGESFGELRAEQLFEALAVIRTTGRLLRLQAVARRDVRAGDQLDFDLVVK